MEDLLSYLARSLVDSPDEVSVESFEEEDGTIVVTRPTEQKTHKHREPSTKTKVGFTCE